MLSIENIKLYYAEAKITLFKAGDIRYRLFTPILDECFTNKPLTYYSVCFIFR